MHLNISAKLALPAAAAVLISVFSSALLSIYGMREQARLDTERYRMEELNRVKHALQERVVAAHTILEEEYRRVAPDGSHSPDSLRLHLTAYVHRTLSKLRYDQGVGYIWVNDAAHPFPHMIMHPTQPHLDGQVLDDTAFNCALGRNENLFVAMRDSTADGIGTFIDYLWPKPLGDSLMTRAPKLSFVMRFKPLDWVIGSGMYIDDIEEAIGSRTERIRQRVTVFAEKTLLLSAGILLLLLPLAAYLGNRMATPIRRLADASRALAQGRCSLHESDALRRSDEIGELARDFQSMAESVSRAERDLTIRNRQLEDANRESLRGRDALRESENKYRRIFESFQDIYFCTNLKGELLMLSPSVRRILGYPPEEWIGKHASGLYCDPAEREVYWKEVLSHGAAHDVEVRLRRRDGTAVWCSVSAQMLSDHDGTPTAVEGVARDIDARKKAEERERLQRKQLLTADRLKSLGTLVAGVAHEINNPLNFISLGAENIGNLWGDVRNHLDVTLNSADRRIGGFPYAHVREAIPRFVESILEGGARIQRIVSGLRNFARAGKDSRRAVVDLNAVARAGLEIAGTSLRKTTRSLTVELDESLPFVTGNAQLLEQVVVNLLTNAAQALASPDQAITVRTSFDAAARRACLHVIDQGVGIDPNDLSRIFDPFFTTRQAQGGTGIGLSISYGIIEDHGGSLKVESRRGAGTTVTMALPIVGEYGSEGKIS